MATAPKKSNFEVGESRSSRENTSISPLRNIPKSWLIAAVVFYCASLLTVGLLAGLVPRRIQYVTVFASQTTTPAYNQTTVITTPKPSDCIDDECKPRLQSDLVVHSYELEYRYNDTTQNVIEGKVTIDFTLKQPIKQLIYHWQGIIPPEGPALFEDNIFLSISMRTYSPNDYISLRLISDSLFAPNRYKLVQKFLVNLNDNFAGFYQSTFPDKGQTTGKLLGAKLRPTNARKAFPCFDEPQLKAKFKISIVHPSTTTAISNFPIIEVTSEGNLNRTRFADTFPMSTYIATWAILPQTYGVKADDPDEPEVTVWARQDPTEKNQTALALQIALNSKSFYEEYLSIAEALPIKIDILAIRDFASVAMESSGLISFREDRIIVDGKTTSTYQKQQAADIVAHEIAHSWFGNYVTCKWWDDLWFSEAMVSWICRKPFTTNYPDWNRELQALTDDLIPIMWEDAKPSSHAIVVTNVTDALEILSYLDGLAYSKGVSVLRMLEKIVGSDKFRSGLQDYLNINAFDVGDLNMFYNQMFTNTNGQEFMKTWLYEPNYPLLNIKLTIEGGNTKLEFTQSRFILSNALNTSNLNKNYRWKINIQCILGGNIDDTDTTNIGEDTIKFILETERESRIVAGKKYSWIKCNEDFQGFYVTEYSFPSMTWQRFVSVLEKNATFFSKEDKVNLMQDTFLLAYKGLVDYTEPLRIVRSLIKLNMSEYVYWRTFQWHWETLADIVDYLPNTLPKFQNFAIQQILSNEITLDYILAPPTDDNHNTKLIKGLLFSFLCRMNHPETIRKVNELYRSIPIEHFNDSNIDIDISADFLSDIYKYHLKTDDNEADWNQMFNYYQITTSANEKPRALVAISSTQNKDRLNKLLKDGLQGGPNAVRRQDYFSMMGYMSRHSIGRETVWNFYKENYSNLVNTFTLENRQFTTVITSITRSFGEESHLQEMNELFTKYPNAGTDGETARQKAIDQVKMNIEWIKSRELSLRNAFDTVAQQ